MELLADIQNDLEPLLRRLVRRVANEPPQPVGSLNCSYPALGIWIANCDYVLLRETLILRDAVFNVVLPDLRVPEEHRKEFANNLEAHCEECEWCGAKRDRDLEWKRRVDAAIEADKPTLRTVLRRARGK